MITTENLQNQALYDLIGTTHSVPLHWCHNERTCSGTVLYSITLTAWISAHITKKGSIQEISCNHQGRRMEYISTCPLALLPNKYLYHIIHMNHSAKSGHHSKHNEQMCSPLKTIHGKIWNRYQTHCTVYKTHAMPIHHGDTRHPVARNDPHIEDQEITGLDSDNDRISGLDATVALGGLETEDKTNELLPSNQAKLMALMREINELCQWLEAREGQASRKFGLYRKRATTPLSHISTTTYTYTYRTL